MEPVISQKLYNIHLKNDRFPNSEYQPDMYYDEDQKILEISYQNIKYFTTSQLNLFDTLRILTIDFNSITELPDTNELEFLEKLNCSNNKIKKIPFYKNLKELIANNNQIHSLENYSGSKLEYLDCSQNLHIKLPVNLKLCNNFHCSESNLETCDLSKFNELVNLDLSNNNIYKIFFNEDKNIIKEISIENNKIDALPSLLPELIYLNCKNNLIKTIPDYPKLKILEASFNKISVYESSNFFDKIIIDNNLLQKINISAKFLDVSSNNLKTIEITEKNEKICAQYNKELNVMKYSRLNLKYIKLGYHTFVLLHNSMIKKEQHYVDDRKLRELLSKNVIFKKLDLEGLVGIIVNIDYIVYIKKLNILAVKIYKMTMGINNLNSKDLENNKIFNEFQSSLMSAYRNSLVFVISL